MDINIKYCKLKKSTQKKLIKLFLENKSARKAAKITNVNRNTAILFFKKLRIIIASGLKSQKKEIKDVFNKFNFLKLKEKKLKKKKTRINNNFFKNFIQKNNDKKHLIFFRNKKKENEIDSFPDDLKKMNKVYNGLNINNLNLFFSEFIFKFKYKDFDTRISLITKWVKLDKI